MHAQNYEAPDYSSFNGLGSEPLTSAVMGGSPNVSLFETLCLCRAEPIQIIAASDVC